jgi:hypothetical protein
MKKLLIVFGLLTLIGCKEVVNCGDPKFPIISFTIIDSVTNLSLVGYDRLYHPDSIMILNNQPKPVINVHSDSIIDFDFGQSESELDEIFKLSSRESDTLKVMYEVHQGECWEYKVLNQFYYNGQPVKNQDYIIQILK